MDRKKMVIIGAIAVVLVSSVFLFSGSKIFGESFEKKIVGEWSNVPVTSRCDSKITEGIRINENGTIEGIEGFKSYKVEETDKEFNYLIADGGYEDIRRYEVRFNEDNLLVVRQEDISEGLTCYFEKAE